MLDLDVVPSWNWWSSYFQNHPEDAKKALPGYSWPGSEKSFWDAVEATGHNFCPSCHGKLFLEVTNSGTVSVNGFSLKRIYCVCVLSKLISDGWDELESHWEPKRLSDITPWDKPKGAAERTKEIIAEAVNFIKYPGEWVFLHGGFGSGKTHVAYAVKSAFGGAALYLNMYDLSQSVFKALRGNALDVLVEQIVASPVLILDDVGAEYPSPFFYSTLYGIINNRYAAKRMAPVFITSNKTPTELLASSEPNYQRIGDRLRDTELVIPLVSKQESYRGK